jgi:DNA-binding transcriptional ArsR family regulator
MLVQAGVPGMPAGEISRALDLAPNAVSFHLKDLAFTELVSARQEGRYVIYSANFQAMNGLLSYLTENCCGGATCEVPAGTAARARKPKRKS